MSQRMSKNQRTRSPRMSRLPRGRTTNLPPGEKTKKMKKAPRMEMKGRIKEVRKAKPSPTVQRTKDRKTARTARTASKMSRQMSRKVNQSRKVPENLRKTARTRPRGIPPIPHHRLTLQRKKKRANCGAPSRVLLPKQGIGKNLPRGRKRPRGR